MPKRSEEENIEDFEFALKVRNAKKWDPMFPVTLSFLFHVLAIVSSSLVVVPRIIVNRTSKGIYIIKLKIYSLFFFLNVMNTDIFVPLYRAAKWSHLLLLVDDSTRRN